MRCSRTNRGLVRLILGFTVLSLVGCGTAHHFVPDRPLEENEIRLAITWHYDFSGFNRIDILPDGNVYVGLGHGWNAGLGLKLPTVYLSHLTAARYWDAGDDDWWRADLHINQIYGLNNNPYFELGGAYIQGERTWSQICAAGLSYGSGVTAPLVSNPTRITKTARKNLAFFPFVKWTIGGEDGAVSLSYYRGMTAKMLNNLAIGAELADTVYYRWEVDQIDSIVRMSEATYEALGLYWVADPWCLFLADGDTITLGRQLICGTGMLNMAPFAMPFIVNDRTYLDRWLPDGDSTGVDLLKPYHDAHINPISLQATHGRGETIVLSRYPQDLARTIRSQASGLSVLSDLSLGVAVIHTNPPSR